MTGLREMDLERWRIVEGRQAHLAPVLGAQSVRHPADAVAHAAAMLALVLRTQRTLRWGWGLRRLELNKFETRRTLSTCSLSV